MTMSQPLSRVERLGRQLSALSVRGVDGEGLSSLNVSREVELALKQGLPVVALESTIVTHGMEFPHNLETARRVEQVIRDAHAVPATIAILDGLIHVGLVDKDLERLAKLGRNCRKCSRRDLGFVIAGKGHGATTVAATMYCANLAGISVFVTGGIGGVHRGFEETMDVSADLHEFGVTPVAVVCAGAKSILDISRTLEYLETQGVPVVGYQTDEFPAFFTRSSGFKVPIYARSSKEIAKIYLAMREVKLPTGMVVANPVPAEEEANNKIIEIATQQALKEAHDNRISGRDVTPFLLKRVNELTGGSSLRANIALILNNARVGAAIAVEMSKLRNLSSSKNHQGKQSLRSTMVVGGAGMDVIARVRSGHQFHLRTSNLGEGVERLWGGVGRNIAEALARLNQNVCLVTAVGDDSIGRDLMKYAESVGIVCCVDRDFSVARLNHFAAKNTELSLIEKDYPTGCYVATHASAESGGDLIIAVENFSVIKRLRGQNLVQCMTRLPLFSFLVIDGNLSTSSLTNLLFAAQNSKIPVWIEPISIPKAVHIVQTATPFDAWTYVSPNLDELIVMSAAIEDPNFTLQDAKMVMQSGDISLEWIMGRAQILIIAGVRNVIVTIGARGVVVCTESGDCFHVEPVPIVGSIVNTNGAGDSLSAGCIAALVERQCSIVDAIYFGLAAAWTSLSCQQAISPNLSSRIIEEIAAKHLSQSPPTFLRRCNS